MAEIHNAIPRGLLSAAATAAVGIVQGDGGVERLDESLTSIIDLWSQPEFLFLRNEALCGGHIGIAAGAATTLASAALVNPAGSRKLIVVEGIHGYVAAVAEVRINLDTESDILALLLAGNTAGAFLDTRWSVRAAGGTPVGYIRSGIPAALVGVRISSDAFRASVTEEPLWPKGHIILSPGFGVVMQNTDDAAAAEFGFVWRERNAFKGELV